MSTRASDVSASLLVAIIAAVVVEVATPALRNATPVGTLEAPAGASNVFTSLLVAIIAAVVVEVAAPVLRNTTAVGAFEAPAGASDVSAPFLVATVAAVVARVANHELRNAAPVGAFELRAGASHVTASLLVATVVAVFEVIAAPAVPNAPSVAARKFIRPARRWRAFPFVGAIVAVLDTVTYEGSVNADALVRLAGELVRRTFGTAASGRVFVRPVSAVSSAVALPPLRDAVSVVARKLFFRTRPHFALLVGAVPAVVFTVTAPRHRYALLVGAHEVHALVRLAYCLYGVRRGSGENHREHNDLSGR